MPKQSKKIWQKKLWEFVRLQIAGNILFVGTNVFFITGDLILHVPQVIAYPVASILAHFLFFVADKEWVFAEGGKRRKTRDELTRFIVFMGFNYIINLAIIFALKKEFGISPYVGQFVSAGFFTFWNYIGLKYWVFVVPSKSRGRDVRK